MKAKTRPDSDDMLPEYDFDYSKGVRGKYYKRLLKEGANVVVLEPDVAKAFRTTEREVLDEIEAYLGHLDISSDKSVHPGQFDFAFV